MDNSKDLMTRYLLGQLSEDEQASLEESYFREPTRFEEIAQAESALIDGYVRDQLPRDTRDRFEQVYLADPRRRERVRFAEALLSRADRDERAHEATPEPSTSTLTAWWSALSGPRLVAAVALASVLLVAGAIGFVLNARRQEAARIEATRVESPPAPSTGPARPEAAPPGPNARRVVALALLVGPGERSLTTAAPTLIIPAGTDDVRLDLTLREHSYAGYRVVLRAIRGAEVLRRGALTPATEGPSFTLIVPASQLPPGDYMLTLQGAERGTDFEDLSQSLFRVTAR
jgi:hypothetical protein